MRIQSVVLAGCAAFSAWSLAAAVSADGPKTTTGAPVPTFTKDVAPILYKNCTTCHRPGEIAPMPLLTYEDARPYAKDILEEVGEGHMPPWHADAPPGTFENERRLSDVDKKTLLDWAANGAPKGTTRIFRPRRTTRMAGRSARPISCSRCRKTSRWRRKARFRISISISRRTSPSRSTCRRSKRGPATARSC